MNKEQIKKLENLVKLGKWKYVFRYGILYIGFLLPIILILVNKYVFNDPDKYSMIDFTLFVPMGFIYGLWAWSFINEQLKNRNLSAGKQKKENRKKIWEFVGYIILYNIAYLILFFIFMGFLY